MNRIKNRHDTIGRIGSWWQENLTENSRRLLRSFVNTPNLINLGTAIDKTKRQLEGLHHADSGYVTLRFEYNQVGVIGPDLQKRIISKFGNGTVPITVINWPESYDLGWAGQTALSIDQNSTYDFVAAEGCQFLLWPDPEAETVLNIDPNDLRPLFVIPVERGLIPYTILLPEKNLTLGVDFYMGEGAIIFRDNPYDLFPDGVIIVMNGREDLYNMMNYTLKVDDFRGSAAPIAEYYREKTSIQALQIATAVAAGLSVILKDCVIQARYDRCVGSRYVTSEGIVDALYEHERLPVGLSLNRGYVIGEGVRIRHGDEYRQMDWSKGLSLDTLSPVQGIVVPDRPCTAVAYEEAPDGKLHVKIQFEENSSKEELYWEHVKQAELVSGIYLNDALGLNALGDSTIINPLDFYFQNLLANNGVLAELRLQSTGEQYRLRARSFLENEKMVGAVLIITEV